MYARLSLRPPIRELYDAWQLPYRLADQAFAVRNAFTDDPDRDGLPNVMEFLLGTSPSRKNPMGSVVRLSAGPDNQGSLSYDVRLGLAGFLRLSAGTLSSGSINWVPVNTEAAPSASSPNGFETVTVEFGLDGQPASRLFRLEYN